LGWHRCRHSHEQSKSRDEMSEKRFHRHIEYTQRSDEQGAGGYNIYIGKCDLCNV
jgi:hypothetical protein